MTVWTDSEGYAHELPKLTMALSAKMELRGKAGEARWRAMHEFLREALPADVLARELDGERIEEVDLSALEAVFTGVEAAYRSASVAAAMQMLDRLNLDQLTKAADAVASLDRQGFRRVV